MFDLNTVLALAVAIGALALLLLAAWGAGAALRGTIGAVVAALVVGLYGAWMQWTIVQTPDLPFAHIPLFARPLHGLWLGLVEALRESGTLLPTQPQAASLLLPDMPLRERELQGPLAAAAAVMSLALAGLAAGLAVNRLGAGLGPGRDRRTTRLLGPSMAGVWRRLAVTLAGIGLLLTWCATLDFSTPLGNNAVLTAPLALWSAPVLAFALLACACHAPAGVRTRAAAPVRTPAPAPPPDLDGLFQSYRRDYGAHLLFDRPATAAPKSGVPVPAPRPGEPHAPGPTVDRILAAARAQDMDPGQEWGNSLAALLDGAWGDLAHSSTEATDGRLILQDASPDALTFLVIAELALSTQERGMTTLVVTDDAGAARVASEIDAAMTALHARETHRVFDGGHPANGSYDMLVASVDRLESEILSADALAEAVRRVGLVVVLDLQGVDATLLRLRLAHLSVLVRGRRPLAFVQSEPRLGLDAQVRRLFGPLGSYAPGRLPRVDAGLRGRRLLVWHNTTALLADLLRIDLGHDELPATALEIPPFLCVRAWQAGIPGTLYDVSGRVDRQLWTTTLTTLARTGGDVLVPREGAGITRGRFPYPAWDDRVIVLEDLANLAEALGRSVNVRGLDGHLLHVLVHDYPLRGYLTDRLGAVRGSHLATDLEAYLPIAPAPEGGRTELALAVATLVRDAPDNAISETHLLERLEEFHTAGADDITRPGLERLMAEELGARPSIAARSMSGHDRHFVFRSLDGLTLDPGYLVPLKRDTGHDQRTAVLDRGDCGLTYATGTLVQRFGDYFEIGTIRPTEIRSRTATGLPTRIIPPDTGRSGVRNRPLNRPRYLFARLYDPDFTPAALDILTVIAPAGGHEDSGLRLLVRGPTRRVSTSVLALPELDPPFAGGARPVWKQLPHTAARPRTLRIHVRFPVPEAIDPAHLPDVALTLAATLQDVLASLFPGNGARLAVLSPQAGPAIARLLEEDDRLERFPAEYLPRLATLPDDAAGETGLTCPPADPAGLDAQTAALIAASAIAPGEGRRIDDVVVRRLTGSAPVIDLILIEDASHDLGCLRAAFPAAGWARILDIWLDYLGWCGDHSNDDGFHYRFGGPVVPAVFAFDTARTVLGRAVGHVEEPA